MRSWTTYGHRKYSAPFVRLGWARSRSPIILYRINAMHYWRAGATQQSRSAMMVYYCHLHIPSLACHRHFFIALAEHGKFRACALNIYQRIAFPSWSKTHRPVAVTCVLYNYCLNGDQVSKTVLTLRFQLVSRGPPGSWHAAVSARAILAYFRVAPSNHEDLEAVQRRSVTEVCSACHRMEESLRVLGLAI